MVRVHLIISGKVQGVFFRSYTEEQARTLGLTGWVRNIPDSKVEAVFEGEQEKIDKIIAWCRLGPPAAVVSDVKADWEKPTGEFK
ncbi:MAG: acylphosphatase, partial [Planctomycetes bacterium]|nr:acylphosphatase [Planctomycetota bacterium]